MFAYSTLPPVLRVHAEIAGMFADVMDLRTICQWRATCKINYRNASSSLRRSLLTRVGAFVLYPQQFVHLVTTHGAVFGGELALSFILRNDAFQPTILEIFVSNYQYERLCDALLDDAVLGTRVNSHSFLPSTLLHSLSRHVSDTLIMHLHNGKSVYIYKSYSCSPSAPISRSTNTAFSNFVSGHSFGCSHPDLTLAKRALLGDQTLEYLTPEDTRSMDRLLANGFSLAVSPTAWPEYRRDVNGDTLESPEECWRDKFICPNQGRYFGDRGSIVGYFDPLRDDEEHCVQKNLPPFGPMVMWRVMSTFECDEGCEYLDDVLDHGVTSLPVLFTKDPFGALRDAISDRCMRSSPYYRSFGRPRSLSV